MNFRKIFFVSLIFLFVLSGISAVSSAFFLDFLDEATQEPDTSVQIHGINFTLPAGYQQDKVNNTTDEKGITTEDYIYGNQEGYMIDISILYNGNIENYKIDDTEHSPKTMGNYEGMASSGKNFYNFIYKVDDMQVSVLARNESVVQKVVTGN